MEQGEKSIRLVTALVECRPDGEYVPWGIKWYDGTVYPFDLKEIGMDDLSLHEKCALQLGWELAGKDDSRDRADMSVEELIDFGETEAEERELEVWLHGYMDPYEGEIDTAKYSMAEIVSKLFSN